MANVGSPQTQLSYIFPSTFFSPAGTVQTATVPQGTMFTPATNRTPPLNAPFPMGIVVTRDITNDPTVLFTFYFAVVDSRQAAEMSFQVLITNADSTEFTA